jgi:dsRNA-specific ribonuclease
MQDKFSEYLNDENQPRRKKALTANSYKKVDPSLKASDTNCELGTYGDALLKCAFCKILFDEGVSNITVEKQKYESDKVLVEIIARHYELLNYIRFDKNDDKIPKDYDYRDPPKKGKDSPSKYIATAVEALIAAVYLDNNEDLGLVLEIVKHWKKLIDNSGKLIQ